ncbi:hypothetical protein K32_14870 [Kaistia sp. 32K]|nr:hypothetical protein K32_14870 [Kaistia sp. 32K]
MQDDAGRIEADNLPTSDDIRPDGNQPDFGLDARSQAGEFGVVTPDALQGFGWKAHVISINDPVATTAQPYSVVDT